MWYVYYRYIPTGREDFVACYDTPEEAVNKIALCYIMDRDSCLRNEYYYFLKKH